jgi:hypothetical protein
VHDDPVIAEIRKIREELAERFNFDLRAIVQDAIKQQATGGRKVVRFPPRPAKTVTVVPAPMETK